MDDYLDRLNTTWERYGGKNTCSVVQIIDRASGRRTGARIYPKGCKVREVVERGFDYEEKTKFDKKGRMKGKKVEHTSKHYVNMIPWPPELENKNIYEPATDLVGLVPFGPDNQPMSHRMKFDTGAEVSLTDWNGMRKLIPAEDYILKSAFNRDIEPMGVRGRDWDLSEIVGVTGSGPALMFKKITIGVMISPGKYQKVENINLYVLLVDDDQAEARVGVADLAPLARPPGVFRVKAPGNGGNLVGTDIMKQLTNYRVKFQNAPGAQDQPINL